MFSNPFSLFGFTGTLLATLAILIASLGYRGKQGERFSLLNHFISELGEIGVSPLARIFNCGMILGGILLLPYIVDLGFVFKSILGWLGVIAGTVAALGVTAVGFFPMNDPVSHGRAAVTYFRAGLVMVLFFGLAIALQPVGRIVVPKSANLLSLLAFLAYAAFLLRMPWRQKDSDASEKEAEEEPERPRVWILAILEWAVFFSTILWLFVMTFWI